MDANGLYERPDGSMGIYVYVTRLLVQLARKSPAMARRKVFVIGDAERMVPQAANPEAANALLKLLEEPPADTTFILTSSEPGALLPTIRSRVVSVRVAPLPRGGHAPVPRRLVRAGRAADQSPRDELIRLANGAPGTCSAPTNRPP